MFERMKKIIFTESDRATQKFYQGLKEHKLLTTNCLDCKRLFFPPQVVCPQCLSNNLSWVELSGRGKIYAFTQQERGPLFTKPDVIGLVELEEGIGRVLTRINGEFSELKIGMEVEVSFVDVPNFLTLHQFRPLEDR